MGLGSGPTYNGSGGDEAELSSARHGPPGDLAMKTEKRRVHQTEERFRTKTLRWPSLNIVVAMNIMMTFRVTTSLLGIW